MIFIDNIMIEGNIYKRRNIKMMILNTISIQVHNDFNCCSFIDFFSLILKIFFWRLFFPILIIHKSCEINHKIKNHEINKSCEAPQICWTDRFSRFDVYRSKNKQTDKNKKSCTSRCGGWSSARTVSVAS